MAITYEGCNHKNSDLREWAPLTDLFNQLPTRIQIGLFAHEVKLTCIDVLPELLAIGTNVGMVFLYNRRTRELKRLRCEKQNVQITVVKIISSVDYMVACGNMDGAVNIFQIPKTHPDCIPDSLKPKEKQIERYIVCDLHKSPVTAIEWSKNSMKLFSGDKAGCIVLTEIDFYMHICKSMEILNESYQVVQLSYNQQRLLVSTTYRSIICEQLDKWEVCQIGKKDRKVLGSFGGIISVKGQKKDDMILYCTRPGLRLWEADCTGTVNKTLLFKDLLKKECREVPIINPVSRALKALKPQKELSFGILLPFNNMLLTYNNDIIYILDPEVMTVVFTMSYFRNVLSVATHKDEIFILEEDRSIVRISYRPEQTLDSCVNSASPVGIPFIPIASSIKDITNKLQNTNLVSDISTIGSSFLTVHTDDSLVMNAEEAKESPLDTSVAPNPELERKFNLIGKREFNDNILFKSSTNRKRHNMGNSCTSLSSNSSEDKEMNKSTALTELSSIGVLPDLRSPESIQSDIEYKERLLANILNLDNVQISFENLQNDQDEKISEVGGKVDAEIEVFADCKPVINSNDIMPIVISDSEEKQPTESVDNTATPACLDIPTDWKLANIQLNTKKESISDSCLTDWEII